jgi:hypothetical protein
VGGRRNAPIQKEMTEQKQENSNKSVKLAVGLGLAVFAWYLLAMFVVLR